MHPITSSFNVSKTFPEENYTHRKVNKTQRKCILCIKHENKNDIVYYCLVYDIGLCL
jgi:hypothetical protein